MRRSVAAVLAALALVGAAGAQSFEPFTVKDIRVEGLQRTEPGTVFSYLPVKVGETMNPDKARAALRALYATGFFQDVRLEVEGDVLVVFVRERPAIAQIDFSGMKEFDAETGDETGRDVLVICTKRGLHLPEGEVKSSFLADIDLIKDEVERKAGPFTRIDIR